MGFLPRTMTPPAVPRFFLLCRQRNPRTARKNQVFSRMRSCKFRMPLLMHLRTTTNPVAAVATPPLSCHLILSFFQLLLSRFLILLQSLRLPLSSRFHWFQRSSKQIARAATTTARRAPLGSGDSDFRFRRGLKRKHMALIKTWRKAGTIHCVVSKTRFILLGTWPAFCMLSMCCFLPCQQVWKDSKEEVR